MCEEKKGKKQYLKRQNTTIVITRFCNIQHHSNRCQLGKVNENYQFCNLTQPASHCDDSCKSMFRSPD